MKKTGLKEIMQNIERNTEHPKDPEELRRKVEAYLIEHYHYTPKAAKELTDNYEEDFPQFWKEGLDVQYTAFLIDVRY